MTDEEHRGIIPRVMDHTFVIISSAPDNFEFTISVQIHVFTVSRYSIIATLAGWPNAFAINANLFCLVVKFKELVAPILYLYIAILR